MGGSIEGRRTMSGCMVGDWNGVTRHNTYLIISGGIILGITVTITNPRRCLQVYHVCHIVPTVRVHTQSAICHRLVIKNTIVITITVAMHR